MVIFISCFRPLYAYRDDLKGDIKFLSGSLAFSQWKNGNYPWKMLIPCGKCVGCRLDYASKWSMRCQLEASCWNDNYFITLTYDDEHLPVRKHKVVDKETGEVIKDEFVATLVPEHFTKFIKDLRRYYDYHFHHQNIRFFGCGEYGSKSWRPHYHIILFNCPILDLKEHTKNFRGDVLYTSELLSSIWKNGFVTVGECNYETCSYVARYTLKKQGISQLEYDDRGIEREFVRCSRMPAIGDTYFSKHVDEIKLTDNIILPHNGSPLVFKPPRYFEKYLSDSEKEELHSNRMEMANLALSNELSNTDVDLEKYLLKQLDEKILKSNTLKREL